MSRRTLSEEVAQRVVDELVEELKKETRDRVKKMLYLDAATYRPTKKGVMVATHEIEVLQREVRRNVKALYDLEIYDDKKFKLGDLCEAKHAWQKTGMSLRYKISGRCVMCQSIYNKRRRKKPILVEKKKRDKVLPISERSKLEKLVGVDQKVHTLGELCAFKHNHEGTGYSLRYHSTGRCVGCNRDYAKKYWKRKKKGTKEKK